MCLFNYRIQDYVHLSTLDIFDLHAGNKNPASCFKTLLVIFNLFLSLIRRIAKIYYNQMAAALFDVNII